MKLQFDCVSAGGSMVWFKGVGFAVCLLLSACASPIQSTPQPAPVVLMGEVHDNPDAHRQRFNLLKQWVEQGWRPVLVMEQFDRSTQARLDQAVSQCNTASCLTTQPWVEPWEWPLYEPLLQMALDHGLRIVAGNVSRSEANSIVKGGYAAALDSNTISQFKLSQPLPDELQQAQQQAIELGHCNMLPAPVAQNMVRAQVARDVFMAQRLIEQFDLNQPVVLIAGNGHVQRGLGVPRWLPTSMLAHTVVYGFVEHAGQQGDGGEVDQTRQGEPHARPDPCEAFKNFQRQ